MDAVTPGMRDQRRRRREAERAGRGEIRRRSPAPHPAGLRALGWSRPVATATTPGARLLGTATAPVAITDRATVTTASRATTPLALAPVPVTRGPLPAAASLPRPARFGAPPRAAAPAADVDTPVAPAPLPAPAEAPATTPSDAAPPAAAATDAATASDAVVPTDAATTSATSTDTVPTDTASDAAPTVAAAAGHDASAAAPTVPTPTAPEATAATAVAPTVPTAPAAPLPSDLFAHRLGLSPANTPAPPAADTPRRGSATGPAGSGPGRHTRVGRRPRDPWASASSGRRGRRLLAAAAVVVVLGGVGTAVGVTLAGRDDGTATRTAAGTTAADAVVVDAATWLSGNVTDQQRIVATDADLARDLNGRGVPVDAVAGDAALPSGAVVVAATTDDAPAAVTSTSQGGSVVLLAAFADDDTTLTVGEVVASPASEVRSDLDSARSTAEAAAQGLRNNAAVRIDGDLDPVFTSGRLDLRAATMLAAIAQDQQVEVVAAPQDRAESRAGRPVRTLVVDVQDAQAVREIAATARAPYAPDVEAARPEDGAPGGSLRLTWPAGAAVTMPFR